VLKINYNPYRAFAARMASTSFPASKVETEGAAEAGADSGV
jgi:hypothetical protein